MTTWIEGHDGHDIEPVDADMFFCKTCKTYITKGKEPGPKLFVEPDISPEYEHGLGIKIKVTW